MHAVHILGSVVEVIYDENATSLEELVEDSGVSNYYHVTVLSDEEADSER